MRMRVLLNPFQGCDEVIVADWKILPSTFVCGDLKLYIMNDTAKLYSFVIHQVIYSKTINYSYKYRCKRM